MSRSSYTLIAATLLGAVIASDPVFAKGCQQSLPYQSTTICNPRVSRNCPFQPPPQTLWDELEPVTVINNTTFYDGTIRVDDNAVLWTDLDIEGNRLVASWYGGIKTYDITNPAAPVLQSTVSGFGGAFPSWIPLITELAQIFRAVSIPDGDPTFAAIGGLADGGFSSIDLTNPAVPVVRYQDADPTIDQIWAAKINGRSYAFAASNAVNAGVLIYDLTASRQYTRCLQETGACAGVYLGKFGGATTYINGFQMNNRTFVVRSSGTLPPTAIEIWEVTNPSSPQLMVSGYNGQTVGGAALWEDGGQIYLGVRKISQFDILNVTHCFSSGCSSLPTSAVSVTPVTPAQGDFWRPVNPSKSGSTPFVFLGTFDLCHHNEPVGHYEMLLDVSNPSSPRDVSPSLVLPFTSPTGPDDGVPPPETADRNLDYWSWYYSDTLWGWANVAPRTGKFSGQYFFRAAYTIGDVHRWVGTPSVPPVADFTWSPSEVYPNTPVTFQDTSSGSVASRAWTFAGGNPPTSTGASPQVTFATQGTKAVSLEATNSAGSNTRNRNVEVLSPLPDATAITASPSSPFVCQPVTLTATATGQPTLTYSWTITGGGVTNAPGNPYTWNTAGLPAASYAVSVTAQNGSGSDSVGANVTLNPLPSLPASGSFTPTNDAFPGATVNFHVNILGATEWSWDFDDDANPNTENWTAWSSDPTTGPNPTHTYTTIGARQVKARGRNCLDTGLIATSLALSINITQIEPLAITTFQAVGCNFGSCFFPRPSNVTFTQVVTGNPNLYEYDWDGNGVYEQSSASIVTAHNFTTAGAFNVAMRVTRGIETVTAFHPQAIIINDSVTPSITVSGPSTGTTGNAYNYSASAANCTGTVTQEGWSWSPGTGGVVSGSGPNVSITWSSAGNKTVRATHPTACGSASGTRSMSITTAGTSITISGPSSGAVDADLQFTAQASGCTASSTWTWSPGSGGSFQGASTGATVTLRYASSGNKSLTVTNSGCSGATGQKSVTIGSAGANCGTAVNGLQSCFTFSPANPGAGQVTNFDGSASLGAITFHSWEFGDNGAATGQTTTHTYAAPGTYNAKLTVLACLSPGCEATHTRAITVGSSTLPVPSFATDATCPQTGLCESAAGQPINFLDTSTGGVTSRLWQFGDGQSSTASSALHTYASGGTYAMKLIATNASGSAEKTTTFGISGTVLAPTAAFASNPACGAATCDVSGGAAVTFTDTSLGFVAQRLWTLSGGSTANTAQVTHTFPASGSHVISLNVSNTAGNSTASKTYNVSGPPDARIGTSATCFFENGVITCHGFRDEPVSFTDTSVGGIATRTWTFGDGISSFIANPTHSWTSIGTFPVVLTVSNAFGSDNVTYNFVIQARSPLVNMTTTAGCSGSACDAATQQVISFVDTTVGRVDTRTWDFGDGATSSAQQVTHAWAAPGNYAMSLTVANEVGSASTARTFQIRNVTGKATAKFTVNTTCSGNGNSCEAEVDQSITFTDTSTGTVLTRSWAFGDGSAATTQVANHAYDDDGVYTATLTVGNTAGDSSASKTITVGQPPVGDGRVVLLPWLAKTNGALVQLSDLSIYNARDTATTVTVEFRRRGQPEANPPREDVTLSARETFRVEDTLEDLFDLAGTSGFLLVEADTNGPAPAVASFNQTFSSGESFGQAVPSVYQEPWPSGGGVTQHLIGLNDDSARLAYFGLSNPGTTTATYDLRAFDSTGALLGQVDGLAVGPKAQKQFQAEELRSRLGTAGKTDFRLEIEQLGGPLLSPYGANLRLVSEDPSFLQGAGPGDADTSYVLGILRTAGPNNSNWTSDLVIANPGAQPISVELSYLSVGAQGSLLLAPLSIPAGDTVRLIDVLSRWPGLGNTVGVIKVRGLAGARPLLQGESYDVALPPQANYGQSMPALLASQAAEATDELALVGLSQETNLTRTTIWLLNPGAVTARATLRYRRLDGSLIGEITNYPVGAGLARQLSPSQHPLPGGTHPGGFTVEVDISEGKVLAAAQVVNNNTNDPSYIVAQKR